MATSQPPSKKSQQLSLFQCVAGTSMSITEHPFTCRLVEPRIREDCEVHDLPSDSALMDVSNGDSICDHFVSERDKPNTELTTASKHMNLILTVN